MTTAQKAQQRFWDFLYPVFPYCERIARPFKWLKANRRQNFLLGHLSPETTLDAFREHLRTRWQFEHVIAAWVERGQVLSWRRRISFEYQYHIRVYDDGEVRGHYEYTPEAAPARHMFAIGQEKRADDFRTFLGRHVVFIENT